MNMEKNKWWSELDYFDFVVSKAFLLGCIPLRVLGVVEVELMVEHVIDEVVLVMGNGLMDWLVPVPSPRADGFDTLALLIEHIVRQAVIELLIDVRGAVVHGLVHLDDGAVEWFGLSIPIFIIELTQDNIPIGLQSLFKSISVTEEPEVFRQVACGWTSLVVMEERVVHSSGLEYDALD